MVNEYIVDRFEEQYAVLEDCNKQMYDVERSELPDNVKVGDVVIMTADGYRIDPEKTESRTNKIKTLMDSLWED